MLYWFMVYYLQNTNDIETCDEYFWIIALVHNFLKYRMDCWILNQRFQGCSSSKIINMMM